MPKFDLRPTTTHFEQSGYEIIYKTYDLHNSDVTDNIETEHEKMFSAEGIKIKYLRAVVKHD
jgi:tRNA (guanine-N7-)-methyltransferase